MWVAQITEGRPEYRDADDLNGLFLELDTRFNQYQFSVLMGQYPVIICRPEEDTVLAPGDEGTEVEILRFMVTELVLAMIEDRRQPYE